GRNSLGALGQAGRAPSDRFSFRRDMREESKIAESKLEPEVKWAEKTLEHMRQAASQRAAEDLKKTSPREGQLADRARSLAREGSSGAGALPGPTLDLLQGAESAMRDAARALGGAEGDRALERLKEAQRLLEMARSSNDNEGEEGSPDPQEGGEHDKPKGDKSGDSGEFARRAPIPRAEDYKGPEAFRRRVLEGLGSASDPRLRDAVKRYAEGLLR
ncbi:MAG TPA: DUF4175 domain-containing protein, partial [Polyangiaceae bacterium]|nr:DUF4175 domain-containing protein [Polyangiaceae bacterium]